METLCESGGFDFNKQQQEQFTKLTLSYRVILLHLLLKAVYVLFIKLISYAYNVLVLLSCIMYHV